MKFKIEPYYILCLFNNCFTVILNNKSLIYGNLGFYNNK